MARLRLNDFLQDYAFHLFDLAIPIPGISAFTPIFGFNKITIPDIRFEIQSVKECNYEWDKSFITGASNPEIVLSQGAFYLNADYWRWISLALTGNIPTLAKYAAKLSTGGPIRKNLLLIHFMGYNISALVGGSAEFSLGSFGFALRVPARAWYLKDCIPTGYKPGSDFDAMSGEISIQELSIKPSYVEEYSLTG